MFCFTACPHSIMLQTRSRSQVQAMNKTVVVSLVMILLPIGAFAAASGKSKVRPERTNLQALTYANVVSHFKAADLRTTEVQKRCTVFFEGEWKNPNVYSYALIIVENSDEDIQVTFYLTDAHEMNWITEFLDAPFFARDETGKLFDVLHSGREIRGKQIGRFRVNFHHWQPKHAEILVFSFTPARSDRR
jgi:hypothetical protein